MRVVAVSSDSRSSSFDRRCSSSSFVNLRSAAEVPSGALARPPAITRLSTSPAPSGPSPPTRPPTPAARAFRLHLRLSALSLARSFLSSTTFAASAAPLRDAVLPSCRFLPLLSLAFRERAPPLPPPRGVLLHLPVRVSSTASPSAESSPEACRATSQLPSSRWPLVWEVRHHGP